MEGSQKWSSPRYRRVGSGPNIDESLFGNADDREKSMSSNRNGASNSARRDSRKLPPTGLKNVNGSTLAASGAIILSSRELEDIKAKTVIKTESQLMLEREEAERKKEEREKIARERKKRMIQLSENAKQMAKKSDLEIAQQARADAIKKAAAEKLDENSDVVKLLQTLASRAASFTIRDGQKEDKEQRDRALEEYERRMDTVMEIDRLKDLQKRESEEQEKRKKRIEDRKVITEQMEERQRMKMLVLEAREQENIAMRNLMKKYEEDDRKAAERRKIEIEKSRIEVIAANEAAIARKHEAKEAMKKDMEDILLYQALKDRELAKREEEEAAIEKAKKDRQAKLLAQQEKSANKQAEIDELRARRAAEEHERRARKKEREEHEKKKADNEELLAARALQALDKKKREEFLKAQQEEEFTNALQHSKKLALREEAETEIKTQKAKHHRESLAKQIEENELRAKRDRANTNDEGSKFRQELIRDEKKLEVIRERMMNDLVHKGVNPKYLSEMKAVDIGKILRR